MVFISPFSLQLQVSLGPFFLMLQLNQASEKA